MSPAATRPAGPAAWLLAPPHVSARFHPPSGPSAAAPGAWGSAPSGGGGGRGPLFPSHQGLAEPRRSCQRLNGGVFSLSLFCSAKLICLGAGRGPGSQLKPQVQLQPGEPARPAPTAGLADNTARTSRARASAPDLPPSRPLPWLPSAARLVRVCAAVGCARSPEASPRCPHGGDSSLCGQGGSSGR